MYDECDGFDPVVGMPVTQYHTASKGHTPPMNATALLGALGAPQ